MAEESWIGSWWRPERAGHEEVGGELRIEDGCQLRLSGTFSPWTLDDAESGIGLSFAEALREPLIHGYAAGSDFSLLRAECDFPRVPGSRGNELWRAEAAVEGLLKPDPSGTQTFTGVRFDLQHLATWLRAPAPTRKSLGSIGHFEVSADPQVLAECTLSSGEVVTFGQSFTSRDDRSSISVSLLALASISVPSPETWQSLLTDWLQPIQVLLWVATAEVGFVRGVDLEAEVEHERFPVQWLRLWAPLLQPAAGSREDDVLRSDVLFHADELPGGFESGFVTWLDTWKSLRHVFGPLFARQRAPFVYSNDRFSTAASAIEAYHRFRAESLKDLPKAEHRARVRRLGETLDRYAPDLSVWAVEAAKPFNKAPMWRRVLEVIERTGAVGEKLLGDHALLFAEAVEDARNVHAHATDSASPLIDEGGGALYFAAAAVVWLLRTCLLMDLGFDPEDAISRVLRNRHFQWTADGLRSQLQGLADAASEEPGPTGNP